MNTDDAGGEPTGYVEAMALREGRRKSERGYQRHLHHDLIEAYRIALSFARNDRTWPDFIADPFWTNAHPKFGRPRPQDRRNALKFVLAWVFDSSSPQGRNRITKYHGAMHRYFAAGKSPERMSEAIRNANGVDNMYAKECERKKRSAPEDDAGSQNGGAAAVPPLQVELTARQLNRARAIDVGKRIRVTCERVAGDDDAWVRLVAKRVREVPPKQVVTDDEWA
jgi:hypothetical protein